MDAHVLAIGSEELDESVEEDLLEAGNHRVDGRIGLHLGGIGEELLAPDEARILTQIDHLNQPVIFRDIWR